MSRLLKAVIMVLATGILGLCLIPFTLGLEENLGLDLLFKLRGPREVPSDVLIVTMDKVSASNLNLPAEPDKWPRSLHARLTENLAKEGASVIAFDIFFDESRITENDNLFAEAIKNAGNVVLCECIKKEKFTFADKKGTKRGELNIERLVPPVTPLAQSALALAPFPLPKVPVKVSQYWTIKTGAGDTPTLPVVVFQTFALEVYDNFIRLLDNVSPHLAQNLTQSENEIIATKSIERLIRFLRDIFKSNPDIADIMLEELEHSRDLSGSVKQNQLLTSLIKMYQGVDSRYLNFYGPPGTIPTIPYYLLVQSQEKPADAEIHFDVKGKAVFIGLSERLRPEQKDGFHTVFSQPTGLDISGVEIAATAFANLLENMPVQPLGFGKNHLVIFLWGAVLGILCWAFLPVFAAISVIGVSAIYVFAAQYQFNYAGSWYPLAVPLLFQVPFAFFGSVMWKYFDTNKERQNIRRAFGYYLPDKIVDQLARSLSNIKSSGQIVYGTCLFTDADQYTTLSETMEPGELHSFMNKYFEALFAPVNQHDGIVAEISGDSMLAIWATPYPDAALRNRACLAALNINSRVSQFNQSSETMQLPTRIGLHSGFMFLGNVGAMEHYEYRPTGDIVNTASRIEGLNKFLGTRILVSEEVLYQLNGFFKREIGKFLFVGKSKPIAIYELLSQMEGVGERQKSICAKFSAALKAYKRQSWEQAIELFHESLKIIEKDGPSNFYLGLCEKYRENPPGERWDGVVRLTNK